MPTHHEGTEEERRALDVYIKLMRAADSVGLRSMKSIQGSGLTPTQFGVLEALYHLGPMMLSELAQKHLKSPNNLTVVTDNLEKHGLVRRVRDEKDRRVIRVYLTDAGRDLIRQFFPVHARSVVAQMSVLTSEEQEQLGCLLRRLGKGER
jgi:MarR family 2-MHQ and catechol resistance regulon transcriptional repressor